MERNKRTRARYEYVPQQAKWTRICPLTNTLGLSTVALCPENEKRLIKDVTSFVNNKSFYKRIGLAFRRGYLFHGEPGTGKTSLVLALASHLEASLYFINLGYIRSDTALIQAFASLPANVIVVLEDVDTQTTVLHHRTNRKIISSNTDQEETDGFNLSTFLSILDGHTLEDGIIFIMTTNHKELLDPAVIRPGRMDTHLDLTLATHYQMRRIFSMIQLHDNGLTLDDIFPELEAMMPEFIIPPSEVMRTMVLYRENLDEIPQQLKLLAETYSKQNRID
ncbi:P-loop containing nucleoside triphosphate hydrolase protein [Halteromyces radiatus]|uniref:P-loop containing nucleoside triphosphate hydrolase protein n=1 Tax=Halteromyces radiatus TaxID=101107 RepID=UPI0022205A19|nr:P-loop containing nucleoside triphosphate hydrolase protein [Halteromyces radiatus]KAI8077710.1 P-loop containing nucleoside triphosphate hydrolase protein [Halteromyces radiatus]